MKILKSNILLFGMTLFAGCTLMLSSCGDDDDDNNGGGGSNVAGNESALVKEGNVLLTSIDGYHPIAFTYDDQLRPVSAYESDGYYEDGYDEMFFIDYKTGKITLWGELEGLSVSFNANGYVTKIQGSWNYTEDGEVYRGSMTQICNYDNSGHLISAETNNEEYEEYDGRKDYEKSVAKVVLTWNNGNLTKTETNSVWYDEKGGIEENNSIVQTFTYGNSINRYRQYPGMYGEDNELLYVGLLGVGPEKLPLAYYSKEVYEYNGRKEEYESSWSAEFTLNENGSIDTETWTDTEKNEALRTAKFNYTPADGYKPKKTRALLSPYMSKSATGKGKNVRNLLKRGMFKSVKRS